MIIHDLHSSEIDPHVLAETHLEQAALTCIECKKTYVTGDDWPGTCKECGSDHWDLFIYFDMRDLNFVTNMVVL